MMSPDLLKGIRAGSFTTKLRAGGLYIPVSVTVEKGRLVLNFGYNAALLADVKTTFEGRKYHGFIEGDERKVWSIPITQRNLFRMTIMMGKYAGVKPYEHWTQPLKFGDAIREFWVHVKRRTGLQDAELYQHQFDMVNEILTKRFFLAAAQMGLGKTLATAIAVEMSGLYDPHDINSLLWVGPKSAIVSAKVDFSKWKVPLAPHYSTYDNLVKIATRKQGLPRILVLDEVSRCKNPTAQRSLAAASIADTMRLEFGDDCIIVGLSGTPAPKTPVDYWMLTEIIRPGFLYEGSWFTLRERLGVLTEAEAFQGGGTFKKLHTWKDNPEKCNICGERENHSNHAETSFEQQMSKDTGFEPHAFVSSQNEVQRLGTRLAGLVRVWRTEDCLDIPNLRFEVHDLEPTDEILNMARTIVNTYTRGADALIALRTLSDGFLYEETPTTDQKTCEYCNGSKLVKPDGEHEEPCAVCEGQGWVYKVERTVQEIPTPKLDLLTELLEQHDECGRFCVYAGFQGSIQRVVKHCLAAGWTTIKADGQGWTVTDPLDGVLQLKPEEAIDRFQNEFELFTKMVFVGQPGAAGMGLTLTASPSIFFYSNDFIPENRLQAQSRGHRPGMRVNGGRIIDCVHLPSDRKVISAISNSIRLQTVSMDAIREWFK